MRCTRLLMPRTRLVVRCTRLVVRRMRLLMQRTRSARAVSDRAADSHLLHVDFEDLLKAPRHDAGVVAVHHAVIIFVAFASRPRSRVVCDRSRATPRSNRRAPGTRYAFALGRRHPNESVLRCVAGLCMDGRRVPDHRMARSRRTCGHPRRTSRRDPRPRQVIVRGHRLREATRTGAILEDGRSR